MRNATSVRNLADERHSMAIASECCFTFWLIFCPYVFIICSNIRKSMLNPIA